MRWEEYSDRNFDVLPDHITGWTDRCGRKLYFPRNRNVQHGKKEKEWIIHGWRLYHCQNVPQGELGGTVHLKNKQIKNPGIWLIVLPFISSIVTGILYVVIWVVLGFGVVFSSYGGF